MSRKVIFEMELADDEQASVGKRKTNQHTVGWDKLGNGWKGRAGRSVNAFKLIQEIGQNYSALWLFLELCDRRSRETNVVILRRSSLNSAEYKRIENGLPLLVSKGMAIRLGHERYMLNPSIIIPAEWKQAVEVWKGHHPAA